MLVFRKNFFAIGWPLKQIYFKLFNKGFYLEAFEKLKKEEFFKVPIE